VYGDRPLCLFYLADNARDQLGIFWQRSITYSYGEATHEPLCFLCAACECRLLSACIRRLQAFCRVLSAGLRMFAALFIAARCALDAAQRPKM
jgi:hypothetical protein